MAKCSIKYSVSTTRNTFGIPRDKNWLKEK